MCKPGGADLTEGQGEAGGCALLLPPAVRVTPALSYLEERTSLGRWSNPYWLPGGTGCSPGLALCLWLSDFLQGRAAPEALLGLWKPCGQELSAG